MLEFSIAFALGAACATAITWWLWKSTDDERNRLQTQIDRLKAQITEKM